MCGGLAFFRHGGLVGSVTGIFSRYPTTCHERTPRIAANASALALEPCKDTSRISCNNCDVVVARIDAITKLSDALPRAMNDPRYRGFSLRPIKIPPQKGQPQKDSWGSAKQVQRRMLSRMWVDSLGALAKT